MHFTGCKTIGVRKKTGETFKKQASDFVSYLMRPGETGVLEMSDVMRDPHFRQAIVNLKAQQKIDFYADPKEGGMLERWKNRVLTDNDSKQVHAARRRVLGRAEVVEDSGTKSRLRRRPEVEQAYRLVHDLALTQLYREPTVDNIGEEFLEPIAREDLMDDPNAAAKLRAALVNVRKIFPENLPLVLTLHLDGTGKPHIQGWFSTRTWNKEKAEWNPPRTKVENSEYLKNLWPEIAKAVTDATGTAFNLERSNDPLRPVITVRDKRTSFWVQKMSHDEFLNGDFLRHERSERAREACQQLIKQAKYDDVIKKREQEHTAKCKVQQEMIRFYQEFVANAGHTNTTILGALKTVQSSGARSAAVHTLAVDTTAKETGLKRKTGDTSLSVTVPVTDSVIDVPVIIVEQADVVIPIDQKDLGTTQEITRQDFASPSIVNTPQRRKLTL